MQDRTATGIPTAASVNLTTGTATYKGSAVGYSLHSTTGRINDAGHFTADATLTASFGTGATDTLEGMIDNFKGSDNESRPWSVKLNKTTGADGLGSTDVTASIGSNTTWTIGKEAASSSGSWRAQLWNTGSGTCGAEEDNIPNVATGDFHTLYNNDGKMIGAFGADQQ
ncbi:MAG: hypothetical protein OXC68_01030 [Aestuariivita sp.]|nr:hypothetical protein [Aestuariivita sp.]